MPYPSILPPVDDLVKMRKRHRRVVEHVGDCRQGHTLTEIAETYSVKRQSVYGKLRSAGLEATQARYSGVIPWAIAPEHRDSWDVHMLRELAKRNLGKPPGYRGAGAALDMWLAELDRTNKVVDYSREKGFLRRKRREGEQGYVRQPKQPGRTRSAPE